MTTLASLLERHETNERPITLYHGSMYKQEELMPGFKRSGELTSWDGYENNTYLYASSHKNSAIMLGLCSAWEKVLGVEQAKVDDRTRTIRLKGGQCKGLTSQALKAKCLRVDAFLYEITLDPKDGWVKNKNPYNQIDTEYKTKSVISDNLRSCAVIDVEDVLKTWTLLLIN